MVSPTRETRFMFGARFSAVLLGAALAGCLPSLPQRDCYGQDGCPGPERCLNGRCMLRSVDAPDAGDVRAKDAQVGDGAFADAEPGDAGDAGLPDAGDAGLLDAGPERVFKLEVRVNVENVEVTSSPLGIDQCGVGDDAEACTQDYLEGTRISLEASGVGVYVWGNCEFPVANTCTLTLRDNELVTLSL